MKLNYIYCNHKSVDLSQSILSKDEIYKNRSFMYTEKKTIIFLIQNSQYSNLKTICDHLFGVLNRALSSTPGQLIHV